MEANNRVPWEDLQYLFGEIMYGGHITDDWDRRLCKVNLFYANTLLVMEGMIDSNDFDSEDIYHWKVNISAKRLLGVLGGVYAS